ncbi:ATPase [Microbacterium sp. AZCO]|uniref:ATP-binding protein n=1 Tax=Microbacterium sp. AZCO TaxID=3142976 RepID=UPI0031F3ACCC
MRLRFFGGLALAGPAGETIAVHGRGQQALLFRLAVDAGTTVAYRPLAEDVWPEDAPEDPRASLQSLVSRLRRALGADSIESTPGGYRLAVERADVDVTEFQDLVAAARTSTDPVEASALSRQALALWTGDPWTPGPEFDWVVRDLLEDRAHAERLARVTPPPAEPAAVPPAPAAIPAALTPLVGRQRELATIGAQLGAERLVTLIGPGGAGKTTLALETARAWGDATVVVELAPAAAGEVWAAVAAAAGRSIRIGDASGSSAPLSPRQRALDALAGRRVLIVLDNCEHVSAEAADVALTLLRATPAARILATSREPLGIAGEAFVDLGPLPAEDAVELFARRVRAARGTGPADDEAATVERIVRRLDGLPLALELAAARARTLTLAEIDEGLDDRFALLAAGPRTADPRHQTLRALIDWSWETLTDAERDALLAASVFPDGIAANDTRVVATQFETDAGAFDQLVDRSLLRRSDGGYRMLETVREYGLDRLRATAREPDARGRQARAMVELARPREPLLRGPKVRQGLAWFDANDENFSAALRTCVDRADLVETGVELVRVMLWPGLMRERFEELTGGIGRFASGDAPLDSEAAVVVNGVGMLLTLMTSAAGLGDGDLGIDRAEFERGRARIVEAAAQHPSDLTAILPPLLSAAAQALARHDGGWGWSRGFEVPDIAPDAPAWSHAFVAMIRSAVAQNSGDVDTLGVESERAVRMFRDLGDVWGIAFASQMRSEWLTLEGRLEEALAVADASTEGFTGLTSVSDLLQQRSQGLAILLRLGRLDEARARLAQIEATAKADGSDRALAQARMTAATVDIAAGDGEAALRHLDGLGSQLAPNFPDQLTAWAGSKRAQALILVGRADDAAAALRTALALALRSGDQPIIADVALSLAGCFAGRGQDASAARALAASAALRGRVDASEPFYRRIAGDIEAAPELSSDAALEELQTLAEELP